MHNRDDPGVRFSPAVLGDRGTRTARRGGTVRSAAGAVVSRFGLLLTTALASFGCAVHYTDVQAGTEHLWGLGQLRVRTRSAGDQRVSVASGSRTVGLCLEVGRDQFGLAFGYLVRQRLAVVESDGSAQDYAVDASQALLVSRSADGAWAIGHLRSDFAPCLRRHQALLTGKALAGLAVHAGNNDHSLSIGVDARQRTVLAEENGQMTFDGIAPGWPGFDLFALRVNLPAPTLTLFDWKGEP